MNNQTGNYPLNLLPKTGEIDSHGDVIMPGAFKKSDVYTKIMDQYGVKAALLSASEHSVQIHPLCDICHKPINGKSSMARGKFYCTEHIDYA